MRRVALVILAAGESKRLGQPKQLLQFRGETLLRWAVKTALQTSCRPIIVVVGSNREPIEKELRELDIQIVQNENWKEGIASSIRSAISALDPAIDGVLLALCDQPFIPFEFYERLSHQENDLAAAEYGGTIGVPAYFARQYFGELLRLTGDQGARTILRRDHPMRLSCPEALIDIDTPESLEHLQ